MTDLKELTDTQLMMLMLLKITEWLEHKASYTADEIFKIKIEMWDRLDRSYDKK